MKFTSGFGEISEHIFEKVLNYCNDKDLEDYEDELYESVLEGLLNPKAKFPSRIREHATHLVDILKKDSQVKPLFN